MSQSRKTEKETSKVVLGESRETIRKIKKKRRGENEGNNRRQKSLLSEGNVEYLDINSRESLIQASRGKFFSQKLASKPFRLFPSFLFLFSNSFLPNVFYS